MFIYYTKRVSNVLILPNEITINLSYNDLEKVSHSSLPRVKSFNISENLRIIDIFLDQGFCEKFYYNIDSLLLT